MNTVQKKLLTGWDDEEKTLTDEEFEIDPDKWRYCINGHCDYVCYPIAWSHMMYTQHEDICDHCTERGYHICKHLDTKQAYGECSCGECDYMSMTCGEPLAH